jgi:glycosyltransferase involved in cell wall biosynthesis
LQKNIKRIYFEGICEPEPYYSKASVLLLTSDFEGFPLVLAEAMSYGVVPVVYHSFLALTDIIADNQNGIIVEPNVGNVFNKVEMQDKLVRLIGDETQLRQLSKNAMAASENFSIDRIYQKWVDLFLSVE